MKKMIFVTLTAIVIALAAVGYASAQTGDKDIAFIPAKNHDAYVAFVTKNYTAYNADAAVNDTLSSVETAYKSAKADLKAIKANNKALKDFNNVYKKSMPDAKWAISKDALVAYFTKDDVKTMVVYNSKGSWMHTLTYYPADKTPAAIVDAIDNTYPKDVINVAIKVEEGSMSFYVVQLEDKTSYKKVTVYNDEVNLIEELTKTK